MRVVTAVLFLTAGAARADTNDIVGRPLVLDDGELEAEVTLAANVRTRRFGEPLSVQPDVWFGVTPRLTVGITHSSSSLDEFDPDRVVCLRRCDVPYAGGIDMRYRIRDGALAVAPRARLAVRDVEPFKPALALGTTARWSPGRFSISLDPYLRIGLANTDLGNRATLVIPVELAAQPTNRWMLGFRVGYHSALAVERDGWRGPIGVITKIHPIDSLEVGMVLGFPSLIGPQHEYRERTLLLTVGWRQAMW